MKKGKLFVISAPAGAGKTTLVEMLQRELHQVVKSVSFTTRKPREKEVNGIDYHFIDLATFQKMKGEGDFVESAEVFGNFYGTSKANLQRELDLGKHVILVIDTQGAAKIRRTLDAIFIFIMPPSLAVLEKRLKKRKTESDEEIKKRLSFARDEMDCAPLYDFTIVNEDLDKTYQELRSLILSK